jgi:hypothetical protein
VDARRATPHQAAAGQVAQVAGEAIELWSADLRLALERMCQYSLKINPLKCAFGVLAGKFLGFIIHEKAIEIDPK